MYCRRAGFAWGFCGFALLRIGLCFMGGGGLLHGTIHNRATIVTLF